MMGQDSYDAFFAYYREKRDLKCYLRCREALIKLGVSSRQGSMSEGEEKKKGHWLSLGDGKRVWSEVKRATTETGPPTSEGETEGFDDSRSSEPNTDDASADDPYHGNKPPTQSIYPPSIKPETVVPAIGGDGNASLTPPAQKPAQTSPKDSRWHELWEEWTKPIFKDTVSKTISTFLAALLVAFFAYMGCVFLKKPSEVPSNTETAKSNPPLVTQPKEVPNQLLWEVDEVAQAALPLDRQKYLANYVGKEFFCRGKVGSIFVYKGAIQNVDIYCQRDEDLHTMSVQIDKVDVKAFPIIQLLREDDTIEIRGVATYVNEFRVNLKPKSIVKIPSPKKTGN
jgi:hypothetical protein